MSEQRAAQNTDRELFREPGDWRGDYYANSCHVTEAGAIGIDVAGRVIVRPLADWHGMHDALEKIATGAIVGEPDNHADALALCRQIASEALGR